jgi:hypothetical protein
MIVFPLIRSVGLKAATASSKGRDVADDCPQSSVPHPPDDLTQLGAIGHDDEVDRSAVGGSRLGRPGDGHPRSSGSNQVCGPVPDVAAVDIEHQIDSADVFQGVILEVDELLRASQPHIYALGDDDGGPQHTYISLDDSRVVLDQLIGARRRSTADRTVVPSTIFMTPPLATVGLTEREAREAGYAVKVARQAVAVDAQELINTVALAMRHGIKAADLRDAVYTHPSSTEAFNDVLATDAQNARV